MEIETISFNMTGHAIPVISPPAGKHADPPSLLAAVVATTIVLQLITFPLVAARAYVNVWTRTVRAEDVFSYIAWATFIAQSALICINSRRGLAAHYWDVSRVTMTEAIHRYNTICILYTFLAGFAKASVRTNAVDISSPSCCSYYAGPSC